MTVPNPTVFISARLFCGGYRRDEGARFLATEQFVAQSLDMVVRTRASEQESS